MKKKIDLPQVSEVTLPEVFHLRPGVYILILLAIALLLVVFFVTIFPALIKGGRYVTFSAPLDESGIYLDGVYLGGSEHQYFIKTGSYKVDYYKGGINYATADLVVDRPLFLTALIHRTKTVDPPSLDLDSAAAKEIIRFDLNEIAQASAILDYDMVIRQAPLYRNLAGDLTALGFDPSYIQDAMLLALHYVTAPEIFEDAARSVPLLNDSLLTSTLSSISDLFGEEGHITQDLPQGETPPVNTAVLQAGEIQIPGALYDPVDIKMGKITPLQYPQIKEMPVVVQESSFALALLPVSQYQYALFVEENPQWARSNLANLKAQGLVDDSYLDGIALSTLFASNRPITNISWHAANAFSQWIGKKSGKRVFLPTEAMFTVAAVSHPNLRYETSIGAVSPTDGHPAALLGGVWEMTSTPYIPLARLLGYERALKLHTEYALQVDPIVKGGSYLTAQGSIDVHTVGVIDNAACSEQIGFRIAWEQ
jgi:iron(II)-dependent oxidoreductase